jgi:protein-tyrosine-phosphatase
LFLLPIRLKDGSKLALELEVICKRNEVRSPFLASFLKLHLDGVEISSSGVLPLQKHMNDPVAKKIATEWGFEYKLAEVRRTTMNSTTRLHLPVDSLVQSELKKFLKLEQILRLNLAENSSDVFTPLDPIYQTENEMKYELAKLLGFAAQQLRRLKIFKFPQNLEAIIPRNPLSAERIFADLAEVKRQQNVIVVDASLKVSNQKLIQVPKRMLQVPFDPPSKGALYSPVFEFTEPEKILCSLRWRVWLTQLTEVSKVIIVTPPLEDQEGNKIYDSHLAAIWAEVKSIA